MHSSRRVHVGARLGGVFGLVALLLIISIGVAVDNILTLRRADRQVAESAALQRDASTAKFRAADFNGWQTGYAFDTIRGVPGAAADDGVQRSLFLASTAAFRQDLARIAAHPLTPAQEQQLSIAQDAFDHFMDLDAQIVAGYRSGDPAQIAAANDLVAGEELQWFATAADAVNHLAELARADADADTATALRTSSRALTIMIVVGVACVLLAIVLTWVATRTAANTARHKATLAAIVEQSADATVALTLDGIVTVWNSGAERIYGYTAEEAIGSSAARFLLPSRAHMVRVGLSEVIAGRQFQVEGGLRIRKDGTQIKVSSVTMPIRDENGVVVAAAVLERDITARMRREADEKLATDRAARTARLESLGQLAGGVAHDFNNLLAIILNCAEFIADEPGEQAAEDLARIRDAAQRGQALTSQLLLFAKREPTQDESVDLNSAVAGARDLLGRTLGASITLRCQTYDGALPVRTDRGRLDQILLNLVINARDAMPDGGVIQIDTDRVDLAEDGTLPLPPGHYAQLTVSDNGIGMSAEVRDRLFEPFFTTKAQKGTGLGLATVYGIVLAAEGTIRVDSTPGVGTTFRIVLPIVTAPAEAGRELTPMPGRRQGNGERVLVVEDEDALRDVVVRILNRNGYRTIAVRDADAALQMDLDAVDLLITDMMLPDRSGPAVADEMHSRRPGLPVVFMTGQGDPVVVSQSGAFEATRVVFKPFSAAELLDTIGKALEVTAPHPA
ncbi:PAS domain S-box-containing protein [Krasilnikovia cinnamomea]|uniref:histidine kinase n=1 Tax=Krasilnikovia cinnamomea TaxID=349313 RepID=A0A4Q7ZLG9_9ACTN|nr:PAS domain-containing sensor histidine kinase [Krasilnikovia cinnamomea]RZU51444.1 PAS domain S-box-containing protein [Krasilnikovia cinnamomea]